MSGPRMIRLSAKTMLLAGSLGAAGAVPAAAIDFKQQTASAEVRQVANWALQSGDSGGFPYLIVDKVNARVFVFDARGHLQGADAALLGMARGDRIEAGIGNRKLSAIAPSERITPAGRFMASIDHDLLGGEILLIDYASSIALHPVVKGVPSEHRAERLNSPTTQDNRISYGCINVPAMFYASVVSPAFIKTNGVVYILPEMGSAKALFESPAARARAVN